MSYDIRFKVKVAGTDKYVTVGNCSANITWNLRDMIVESTGLDWKNEANNGLCKDVIYHIANGLDELTNAPEIYKKYEARNGWGTLDDCKCFFLDILNAWAEFNRDFETRELFDVTYFWIE